MKNYQKISNLRGFTLIELLVVVVMIGITASFAVPSFNNVIRNNRILTGTDIILSSFQLARTEAIKRKTGVTICILASDPEVGTSAKSCTTAPQMNASKTRYVAIFEDEGTVGSYSPSDDDLIFKSTKLNENLKFTVKSPNFYNRYSLYKSDGTSAASNATNQTRYLTICDDKFENDFGRLMILSNTGRVQSKKLIGTSLPSNSPKCKETSTP